MTAGGGMSERAIIIQSLANNVFKLIGWGAFVAAGACFFGYYGAGAVLTAFGLVQVFL